MIEDEDVHEKLIKPYSNDWTQHFHNIGKVLLEALSGIDVQIEHIGSTSIPGLAAKPIIDIDIVFQTSRDFLEIKDKLFPLGYFHKGDQGIPGREVFKRIYNESDHSILSKIQHHLYACNQDSIELKRHIVFRNYLREHEPERREYQQLKLDIAHKARQDKKLYAKLKEGMAREFIESIIKSALTQ